MTGIGKVSLAINKFFAMTGTKTLAELEKGKATIEDAKKMLADLDQDIEDRGKIGASKQQLDQREAILKYIEALEIMGIAEEQATQKSNSFVGGFVNGLKEIQSNLPTLAEEGKKFATSFETFL